MALAISCWVRDTALVVNKRELEYKKAMLASISVSSTTFDSKIPGMHGYKKNNDMFRKPAKNPQREYAALLKG